MVAGERTDLLGRHRLAVDHDLAVADLDGVAGQADHALDPVLVRHRYAAVRIAAVHHRAVVAMAGEAGPAEHHHVAALGFAQVEDLVVECRQAQAIGEFVDQDEIAHVQRRHHRAGRDAERLGHERPQQQHHQHHREQRARPVHRHRVAILLARRVQPRLALLVQEQPIQPPHHAEQHGEAKQNRRKIKFHEGLPLEPGMGNREWGIVKPLFLFPIPDSLFPAFGYLSTFNTARKASWGISTRPTCFIRFLPSFCFSSSFFLRLTSPP